MKRKIVILFFLLVSLGGFAQKIAEFSEDSVKFIKELNIYFQDNSADKDMATKFIEDFAKFWKAPDFNKDFKQYMYTTSNKMLNRKLKPFPYFQNYIIAVSNFIEAKRDFSEFESWQVCIDKILKSKNARAYGEFLEMSLNLFENNVFYKSPSYEWLTDNNNYKFEYDSLPKLVFNNFTLTGRNPRFDSISIQNASGFYYPSSGIFYGKGGKVSWERTGLDNKVFATLKKYTIVCKSGGYSSDSVVFTHPAYFDKPQMGKFVDKIITENSERKTYPRFDTYAKRLEIKSAIKDIYYEGGFSMRGPAFVGSGDSKNPARVIIKRENKRFLEVSARSFQMSADKVSSENASIKIYLDKDSITHPSLNFKYLAEQRKVSLLRTDDGIQKTPFSNSFHKVDMYFEELSWKIDSLKIDFGFLAANEQGQAFFESWDFFTSDRFQAIKGQGNDQNPMIKINQFYEQNGKQMVFDAVELAKFMKWTAVDLRPVLIKMSTFGVIEYNAQTDEVRIKDRMFKYLKANRKLTDYDVLTIHSVYPGKANATLNLLNNKFDIKIRGVKSILLSDTQKVFVFPKNKEVILKKGRDLAFDGVVASGKFEFHGKEFYYDYDNNKVNLKMVDSLRIFVTAMEADPDGNVPFKLVKTVIENISGELDVDHPKNHAGYLKFPQYPIFKSFKESYAFYDKRSIQKGVYNKDKFYFKLDPFEIDSVDNFTNKGLIFGGEFASSGIFPTFRESLTLQSDYSLGFIRKTPEEGYPLYGGKANYKNEIRLSNKGLRGDGDIKFGPSLTKSKDIIFFPDSMNALGDEFDIYEQDNPVEFPQVHGEKVYVHYMPYKDVLQAYDKAKPFESYNKQADYHGRLDLTPSELTGRGKVDFSRADLIADKILFKQKKFFSDTANFHLKAFDEEGFTFATDNVNSTIDFEKRTGMFATNGKGSVVRFPKNDYICYMDRFKWFMDSETIQLGDENKKIQGDLENDLALEAPEFISVHPKQDSLRFFAPAANYNLRKYIIKAINVPFINSADARFFPDSGKVTIFKNAVMDTLRKANMLANTVTKYHNIKKVTANIYGRKSYRGKGYYDYVDENKKAYPIFFASIYPDTSLQTVSEGTISDTANFKFSDYFSFAGKVKLFAQEPFLFYDGGTKIVHNCKLGRAYLKFNGEIDPNDIQIPIPENPVDMNGNKIGSGIIFSPDTNMVYSAFLSNRGNDKKEKEIISVNGFLAYDKEKKEYQISNKEKLVEQSLPGNYISLSTENCLVYSEGKMDMGADLGQVQLVTVGDVTHNNVTDSVDFNLMMLVDFFFDKDALKKMFADMEVYLNTAPAVDFSNPRFQKGLNEILGKERADKAMSDLNLYGGFRRWPDELEKTLFITNVNMVYNKALKAFLSTGKIGVGSVNKKEIFRNFPGIIQIKKQRAGDMIDIYFELDQNTWYYFSYFKGVMNVVSSNQEFNNIIKELKPKARKKDVDKGPSYQFNLASPTKRTQFVKKVKALTAQGDE